MMQNGLDSFASEIKSLNLSSPPDGHSERFLDIIRNHPADIAEMSTVLSCVANGFAPTGYGIADFSIVRVANQYHAFYIPRVPGNSCIDIANEHWFGHAVSQDLDTWTVMNPALCVDSARYCESGHIWAPFVMEHLGTHHMFYAGLSTEPSQVICHATSSSADLSHWTRDEKPILPLEGFGWHWRNSLGHVRHGRDPHVLKTHSGFLMVYTAMHANGCPAVGGVLSNDLLTWADIGPVLYRPMTADNWMPESVNVQRLPDQTWCLIPSMSPGLEYYIGDNPHSWHDIVPTSVVYVNEQKSTLSDPVAPEVIARRDHDGVWLVAYFETNCNRMFFGELSMERHPWTLTRLTDPDKLATWLP